jgi:ubiquitin carboxyl-terminal hydrolase 9/13
MSRLRRAFTSEKKPVVPETPYKPPLTAAQQANASYWDAVEEEHVIGLDSVTKGKGREIERLWGLENFGNTCYCNSVLQALYACEPFKQFIESYPTIPPPVSPLGPSAGSDLFKALPLEKQVSMTNFNNTFMNGPASPVAVKSNPFDNPQLATSPSTKPATPGGKEKRGWGGLGRKQSTSNAHSTMSNSPSTLDIPSTPAVSAPSPSAAAKLDIPIIVPDPNQPAPTVFETIQTLFHHLTTSPPHQPISVKKPDANSGTAQTASLLPIDGANGAPTPSLSASSNGNQPQGPPLLASLPPPSAPRAGGPYAAGSLGRGVVRPEDLLKTVKKENEMFRGMSQQDAHEFLGWLLNRVAEEVELLDKGLRANGREVTEAKGNGKTFVQNLFEGVLTNETRCLSCETVSTCIRMGCDADL